MTKKDWSNAKDVITTETATPSDKNLKVQQVTSGANTIYIQTPDRLNTKQLLRVRYALDEEDLEDENIVGRTGEVEEYIVNLHSGINARFVDSINNEESLKAEDNEVEIDILKQSSQDKFIQDLGIVVDRGGINTNNLRMDIAILVKEIELDTMMDI